jgi:ech hydrogenase subunit D
MIENLEILPDSGITARANELRIRGYRFVTMTACTNADETVDIFYSFDCDLKLVTLKTTVRAGATVKSVSDVYLAAAFAENEISELFEVKFSGLAVDYGGHFMLADGAPESPFGAGVIIERKGGGANAG